MAVPRQSKHIMQHIVKRAVKIHVPEPVKVAVRKVIQGVANHLMKLVRRTVKVVLVIMKLVRRTLRGDSGDEKA